MFHQPLVNDIEPGDCSHVVTTKTSNRHSTGGFPSALQDSPYLSSPIRPIPSFRSDSTRKSKRSISCNSRASSPRSTSLPFASEPTAPGGGVLSLKPDAVETLRWTQRVLGREAAPRGPLHAPAPLRHTNVVGHLPRLSLPPCRR